MKTSCKETLIVFFIVLLIGFIFPQISAETVSTNDGHHSAVFGGGPFYSGGLPVMNTLRTSGFTTILIWSIHVHENGTFYLNDELIIENGIYVGNPDWPDQIATLKQYPTSINRIEFSVGAWGCADFENIESLINSQGTGPDSILYKNFHILKNISNADAINYDDESNYHVDSTVQLSFMLIDMGYKITLCPYTYPSFWSQVFSEVNSQHPGFVDRVYLQCYAGGSGNNPATWNSYFENITVSPGLWCRHGDYCNQGDDPDSVHTKMSNWKESADIAGGFLWLFDDMLACESSYPIEDYADAINSIFCIYVDDDAEEDWYDETHVRTIQEGINNATIGDTIFVYNGIYYENVYVNKSIELIGEDKNNTIINGSGIDDIIDVSANSVTISNFNISYSGSEHWEDAGIQINADNISINNNYITQNYYGVWIEKGNNLNISNNMIIDNDYGGVIGSFTAYCNSSTISNNRIISNSVYGILLEKLSNANRIFGNSIDYNSKGIVLNNAFNNTIFNNTISHCYYHAIWFVNFYCENNLVYHNNFIDNIEHIHIFDAYSNQWNNTYPICGNYWDDYNGNDSYKGANQDILGADGIGDTPYNISINDNFDYYPYINPNGWARELDVDQSLFDRGFPIRHAADGDWAAAQSFSPTVNTFTNCKIYMRKFGNPEFNLTVNLRTDHPQGSILDTLIFTPEELPSSWTWLSLDFIDTPVAPATEYFIVCPPAPSGVTTSFGYEWGYAFGNQYDGGAFWFTRDGGALWRDLPTSYEFCFKTYGYS